MLNYGSIQSTNWKMSDQNNISKHVENSKVQTSRRETDNQQSTPLARSIAHRATLDIKTFMSPYVTCHWFFGEEKRLKKKTEKIIVRLSQPLTVEDLYVQRLVSASRKLPGRRQPCPGSVPLQTRTHCRKP